MVYWAISDHSKDWSHSLSSRIAYEDVRCSRCVSCVSTKECLRVPKEQAPMETTDLQPDLQYQERPVRILDVATRQTRRTAVIFCRVQWTNHTEAEATWEREDNLKKEFPYLFEDQLESRGQDSF